MRFLIMRRSEAFKEVKWEDLERESGLWIAEALNGEVFKFHSRALKNDYQNLLFARTGDEDKNRVWSKEFQGFSGKED